MLFPASRHTGVCVLGSLACTHVKLLQIHHDRGSQPWPSAHPDQCSSKHLAGDSSVTLGREDTAQLNLQCSGYLFEILSFLSSVL